MDKNHSHGKPSSNINSLPTSQQLNHSGNQNAHNISQGLPTIPIVSRHSLVPQNRDGWGNHSPFSLVNQHNQIHDMLSGLLPTSHQIMPMPSNTLSVHNCGEDRDRRNSQMGSDTNYRFYEEHNKLLATSYELNNHVQELKKRKEYFNNKLKTLEKQMQLDIKIPISQARKMAMNESSESKKKRSRRSANQISRNFKCMVQTCDRCYGSEASLAQHMKLKHPNIPYIPTTKITKSASISSDSEGEEVRQHRNGHTDLINVMLNQHQEFLKREALSDRQAFRINKDEQKGVQTVLQVNDNKHSCEDEDKHDSKHEYSNLDGEKNPTSEHSAKQQKQSPNLKPI